MSEYAPGRDIHRAKKSLGQNFLTDSTVCPRIVEVDGRPAGCAAPEIFFRLQKALLDDLFEATRAD